jgi:hypothetical protein
MKGDYRTNRNAQSKHEREILELRIDTKLTEAKNALRDFNQLELQKLAGNIREPKFKRLRNWSGFIIAVLVAGHIAEWFPLKERVENEANKVISQKLIDPRLTNTLDEALSKKAVPFIVAQVHPIETKAQQLNTNYVLADGRWEQWAEGKMMLATNAIKQGTEKLDANNQQHRLN